MPESKLERIIAIFKRKNKSGKPEYLENIHKPLQDMQPKLHNYEISKPMPTIILNLKDKGEVIEFYKSIGISSVELSEYYEEVRSKWQKETRSETEPDIDYIQKKYYEKFVLKKT